MRRLTCSSSTTTGITPPRLPPSSLRRAAWDDGASSWRSSRTATRGPSSCSTRFGSALEGADELVLTDIYGAGEDPIPGVTVESLAAAIGRSARMPVHVVKRLDEVAGVVARLARPGDVVVTLGAGSIGTVAAAVLKELEQPQDGRRGGVASGASDKCV